LTDRSLPSDPRLLVTRGYEAIAGAYAAQRARFHEAGLLTEFVALIPEGGRILDLGVGAGIPVARTLAAAGFTVVGIDISSSMLQLARDNVPAALLARMDISSLALADSTFDGITAFYSLFHVDRRQHEAIVERLAVVLRPSAPLLVSVGHAAWEGIEDFHGAEMFWSHHEPGDYLKLLQGAGFTIVKATPVTSAGETHYWILARNGARSIS